MTTGAPNRKAGKPRKYDAAMPVVSFRAPPTLVKKLDRLGGGKWIRAQIEKAEEPK